jgi:alpha-1,3-rhamnosyltransferase
MNTDSQPLVTIIVPCYNHENYVADTIHSVVHQTYQNIEIIVIDDGSCDGSPALLEALSKQYGFYYEHQENIGLSATLNKGIKLAKGEYVTCIASDDISAPNKVEILMDAFKTLGKDYAAVFGNAQFIDDNGNIIGLPRNGVLYSDLIAYYTVGRPDIDLKESPGNYRSLLKGNYIPALAVMIRKKALFDIGMYEENLSLEDWNMWLKLSKHYNLKYVPQIVAYYRTHDKNSTKTLSYKLAMDVLVILEREKAYCFSIGLKEEWRQKYYSGITYLAKQKKYADFLKKSIKNNFIQYLLYAAKKVSGMA